MTGATERWLSAYPERDEVDDALYDLHMRYAGENRMDDAVRINDIRHRRKARLRTQPDAREAHRAGFRAAYEMFTTGDRRFMTRTVREIEEAAWREHESMEETDGTDA